MKCKKWKREISGVCGHPNEKRGELNKEGIRRHGKCFDLSAITNGKPKLALLLLHGRHTQTNTHTSLNTVSVLRVHFQALESLILWRIYSM